MDVIDGILLITSMGLAMCLFDTYREYRWLKKEYSSIKAKYLDMMDIFFEPYITVTGDKCYKIDIKLRDKPKIKQKGVQDEQNNPSNPPSASVI